MRVVPAGKGERQGREDIFDKEEVSSPSAGIPGSTVQRSITSVVGNTDISSMLTGSGRTIISGKK